MESAKVLVLILFVLSVMSASLIVNSQRAQGQGSVKVNSSVEVQENK